MTITTPFDGGFGQIDGKVIGERLAKMLFLSYYMSLCSSV